MSAATPLVPAARSPGPRRVGMLLPLSLAGAALLVLPLDLGLTRLALEGHLPRSVEKLIRLSEAFSHGYGAALILVSVYLLDRASRRFLPRMVAGTLLGGFLANGLKLLVSRTRPRRFDLDGNVLDSFSGFIPLGQLPSTEEGFPSAHAATGFALATVLIWRYPQGRWLFVGLAVVSGAQRIFSAAHFPSDVLFGAALGCFAGAACLPGGLLDGPLARLEDRLGLRQPGAESRSGA